MFDIEAFYPSIKEGLLIETLEYAKQNVTIEVKDGKIVCYARKSIFYKEGEPWIKKQRNHFEVMMGSYD